MAKCKKAMGGSVTAPTKQPILKNESDLVRKCGGSVKAPKRKCGGAMKKKDKC